MSDRHRRKHQTVYFGDQELADRFNSWCRHRGVAPGKVIMTLVGTYIDELELQKDMFEVSLGSKEVRFV